MESTDSLNLSLNLALSEAGELFLLLLQRHPRGRFHTQHGFLLKSSLIGRSDLPVLFTVGSSGFLRPTIFLDTQLGHTAPQ